MGPEVVPETELHPADRAYLQSLPTDNILRVLYYGRTYTTADIAQADSSNQFSLRLAPSFWLRSPAAPAYVGWIVSKDI